MKNWKKIILLSIVAFILSFVTTSNFLISANNSSLDPCGTGTECYSVPGGCGVGVGCERLFCSSDDCPAVIGTPVEYCFICTEKE